MKRFEVVPLILMALLLMFYLGCVPEEPDDPDNPQPPPNIGHDFGEMTDPRDGQTYQTIQIGTQTWMAENLKYLPDVSSSSDWSATSPFYYVYGYEGNAVNAAKATDTFETYGALYNWTAALSACPPDWHLPSDVEWTILTDYLGGVHVAGVKMMSTSSLWKPTDDLWETPEDIYGTPNQSGWSGLPGGAWFNPGFFDGLRIAGVWWSSNEDNDLKAWSRSLFYFGGVRRFNELKAHGFSVRCLKDIVQPIDPFEEGDLFNPNLSYHNIKDPRDDQTYKTIRIGAQTWMAQNLNYMPDTGSSWCYNNAPGNCKIYGRLYDWKTARNACPPGWYLPGDEDWTILTDYLGGVQVAGVKMKSISSLWEPTDDLLETPEDIYGTPNQSGWSGLPGGIRINADFYFGWGIGGFWWSLNEHSFYYARSWGMANFHGSVIQEIQSKELGLSVRCLKDVFSWGD